MLTRDDQTIEDCLEVYESIRDVPLAHVGFKDVGRSRGYAAQALHDRIKEDGRTSYMEVVSTSRDICLRSAEVGAKLGVDCLMGGTQVDDVLGRSCKGRKSGYYPFPGIPHRPSDQARRHGASASAPTPRRWWRPAAPASTSWPIAPPKPIRSSSSARRGGATDEARDGRRQREFAAAHPRCGGCRRRSLHHRHGGPRRQLRAALRPAVESAAAHPRRLPRRPAPRTPPEAARATTRP